MININIQGRMGNQLFQYACMKTYSKKWNEQMNIVFSSDKNQLGDFEMDHDFKETKIKINIIQRIMLLFFMVIRRAYSNNEPLKQQQIEMRCQVILNHFGIYWLTNGYYDFKKSKYKNKLFIGYFESEKYFFDNKENIKKEFIIKKKLSDFNKEFYKNIQNTNSIAISIRRGDFVSIGNIVCDLDYYKRALKKMTSIIEDPTFFVFSDDIDWVKDNIEIPGTVFYENKKNSPVETLYLMKSCKNFIISNSTFHWWAQYLCDNENKIVIAPKKWRNSKEKTDIAQEHWILVDN